MTQSSEALHGPLMDVPHCSVHFIDIGVSLVVPAKFKAEITEKSTPAGPAKIDLSVECVDLSLPDGKTDIHWELYNQCGST